MSRFYDKQNNRLIYIDQRPDADFWANHWQTQISFEQIRQTKKTFVSQITRRYIKPTDGLVLEGGCGNGLHVAALVNNGYQCIGVDSAERTIQSIKEKMPDLDIRSGDVHSLDFDDNTFVGYWSIGLIEHYWGGYALIANEMARVLKTGGYLFLTCPYMSPLRLIKTRFNSYLPWSESVEPANFYQFALDPNTVINEITKHGFKLMQTMPCSGLKGFKDEMPPSIKNALQRIYDYPGKSILIRGTRRTFDKLLAPFSGHSNLFLFQRV